MSPYQYVLLVLCITLSIAFNGDMYLTEAQSGGFSVELIHRDSPKSPFYNSSETEHERMANTILRSHKRVEHFYHDDGASYRALQPPLKYTNGEYFMKFSIGTPKFEYIAAIDTGSDLIWVQCQPCKNCFKQTYPIFNPSKSKTYKVANCFSKTCKLIKAHHCKKTSLSTTCHYQYAYGDGAFSVGDVAEETFTFDTDNKNSPAVVDNVIFGCGHDNHGVFNPKGAGIVGLGMRPISLTSQLGATIDNKFSFCFGPHPTTPSFLNFGDKAVVSGPGTVNTPLASGPSTYFYYVNFKGMTVGGKRLDFVNKNSHEGNMILDTGTTLTYVPTDFYTKLEPLVAAQIKLKPVQKSLTGQKLCYSAPQSTFKAPPITVHFAGGDIVLNTQHTFRLVKEFMCFNINVRNDFCVLGNTAQTNFHIGIDRSKKVVSFKPTDCSKFQS